MSLGTLHHHHPSPSPPPALASTQSDTALSASTVRDTVMAEQIGHNVVKSESTSGSPLVDATAHPSTADSAPGGTHAAAPILTDAVNTAKGANERAISANASATESLAKPELVGDAAEPSAGDAVTNAADRAPELSAPTAQAEQVNGVPESSAQGGIQADEQNNADGMPQSTSEEQGVDAGEKKDGNHHIRSNSVKKPATFTKVSATKSFLAKAATPTPTAAAKPGDKLAPTVIAAQPTAKPRLVAKSVGPSLRDIQKARADGPSGPDASKVWNKNRPVPAAPPRHFTDEELKQQYGIHLATRLQTDEDGKESKWADIDDEEDNWVPDQLVWMDGTKSTLAAPQDALLPEKEEEKPVAPPPVKPAEGVKPTDGVKPILANMKKPEPTTRTILKSGASLSLLKQSGAAAAPGAADKPSLKAKSPAPQTKSPWAPVPKVDTVSPINPPVQQPMAPPPPFASQDARSYEPQPPPSAPAPAREIAADTFDRSWREGEGAPRELFNSTNGRYEPAPEGRRGNARTEGSSRKPAVLQRPSQSGAQPAEPSLAFQTRSSVQAEGSWPRRRGSSISQGSIPAHRRMSVSKTSEISEVASRRSSTILGHDARPSPQSVGNDAAKAPFPQQSAWAQQMPAQPTTQLAPAADAAPPAEDPVKVQERIMREKREAAKKRRDEEAEREETARKERLKAKLAALEGAGKSKKERDAEAAAASTAAAEKSADAVSLAQQPPPQVLPVAGGPAETSGAAPPLAAASTIAPALPATAPHLPSQLDDNLPLPTPIPNKHQAPGLPDRPSSDQTPRQGVRAHLSPHSKPNAPQQQGSAPYKAPTSSYSSPGDRKLQPSFARSPNLDTGSTFTPWGHAAPTSNVWGTAGIGNGTFENSIAPVPMMQQTSALPPPPGMGRPTTANSRIPSQGYGPESRSPSMQQPQTAEQQRAYPPPGLDSRQDSLSGPPRLNGMSPAPGAGRPAHPPGPIAPPSRRQAQPPAQGPSGVSAWQAAAQFLPAQYNAKAEVATEQVQNTGNAPARESTYTFNHTFKKTSVDGKLGAPRKYEKIEHTIHDAQGSRTVASLSPAPPNAQTQPAGPFSTASSAQDHQKQAVENTVRIPNGSQNPAHGGSQAQQQPSSALATPAVHGSAGSHQTPSIAPAVASKEQSPPPPETESHPVNTGDTTNPHVKLPRPQAKVKLPPSSPTQMSMHPGAVMLSAPRGPSGQWAGPPGIARPLVASEQWQARFNGLFNRARISTEVPPSPPKTPPKEAPGPTLAVAASSRAVMDVQTVAGATVSLPLAPKRVSWEGFVVDDSSEVRSKPAVERIFAEELSFGSTPKIQVPRGIRYEVVDANPGRRHFANSQLHVHTVEVRSVQEAQLAGFGRAHEGIYLKIPGTRLRNKLVPYAGVQKREQLQQQQQRGYRKHQGSGENKYGNKPRGGGKERASPAAAATTTAASDGKDGGNTRKPTPQKVTTPQPGPAAVTGSAPAQEKTSGWAKAPKGAKGFRRGNDRSNNNKDNNNTKAAPAVATPVTAG